MDNNWQVDPLLPFWHSNIIVKQMRQAIMVKSEIIAIAYSAVVKQIVRLAKSNAESNSKLFALGEEIGLRAADQLTERSTNSYKPDEVVASFLRSALRDFMACQVVIVSAETSYQKTRFTVKLRLQIKENLLSDFIVLGPERSQSQLGQGLNYNAITMGFASGCLKSMAYHPTVSLITDSLVSQSVDSSNSNCFGTKGETIFNVEIWKEKEQD